MTTDVSPTTEAKRRRIIVITADESIIDQIEKTGDTSLLTQIVRDFEADNNGTTNQQTEEQSLQQENKTARGSFTCAICGSRAKGYNFGVITCESCKAFFRRNALKNPTTFPCRSKGKCEITFRTRRSCSSCRLTKCFNSGMRSDRLLTIEKEAPKFSAIEENRSLTVQTNSETNKKQPQLLSSVLSHDNSVIPIDTNILLSTVVIDLLSPRSQPVQQALLSTEDLQRVEAISFLYRKRIELAADDGLPWNPSTHTNNYLQIINSHSVPIMRLLSFFKQIPEFNQLNVDDKVNLIKYNMMTVLGVACALSYNPETNQIIETDSDVPLNTQYVQLVYGYNLLMQTAKIFQLFFNIVKYDEKIIQLTIIILILTKGFSTTDSHEPTLNDTIAVHRAQNYYTELLWKYMEATYGSEVAVSLLSKLIVNVIAWQTVQEDIRNNVLRTLSPKDIDELLPIMKSVLCLS